MKVMLILLSMVVSGAFAADLEEVKSICERENAVTTVDMSCAKNHTVEIVCSELLAKTEVLEDEVELTETELQTELCAIDKDVKKAKKNPKTKKKKNKRASCSRVE